MTCMNMGHGKAEQLSEVWYAVLIFWRKIYLLVGAAGRTRQIGVLCLKTH